MRKRRLVSAWPFLLSVVPGRGLVENLPPHPRKPSRLRKVAPSSEWSQDALFEVPKAPPGDTR